MEIQSSLYAFTYDMGSRGRPFLDLNEPPAEEDEDSDGVLCFQSKKTLPSLNSHPSDLFVSSEGSQRILNNHAFSHAPSVSGFQPFVRPKDVQTYEDHCKQKEEDHLSSKVASSFNTVGGGEERKEKLPLVPGTSPTDAQAVEREEGEWSDVESSADAFDSSASITKNDGSSTINGETAQKQGITIKGDLSSSGKAADSFLQDGIHAVVTKNEFADVRKDENSRHASLGGSESEPSDRHTGSRNSDDNLKGDIPTDGHDDSSITLKQREVKGVVASHALKCATNPSKRQKLDQQKEAMLGKKRNRQTMFLNLEDVKQAGPIKTSTPRRQTFSSAPGTRTVKEIRSIPAERSERQSQPVLKDQKQAETCNSEGSPPMEYSDHKAESNGELVSGLQARSKRLNSGSDISGDVYPPPVPRQGPCKLPIDTRQLKNPPVSTRKLSVVGQSSADAKLGNKKHPPVKKQAANNAYYSDTSVERLLREVTNEKFWHHPGLESSVNYLMQLFLIIYSLIVGENGMGVLHICIRM